MNNTNVPHPQTHEATQKVFNNIIMWNELMGEDEKIRDPSK